MTHWRQDTREKAYTRLCEAITAAGRDSESVFLARLCLLLAEELADADRLARVIDAAAAFDTAPATQHPA